MAGEARPLSRRQGKRLPEPGEIASTVVPVPGQQVDVVVPVTARVLFEGFVPRLGRSVRRGQTIAVLEHDYIQHDANHLNNQRWPFLVSVLSTRRATVELELKASRLRRAQETGDAAVRQMMALTQTVAEVEGQLAEARLAQQQAEKALAMHDAQLARTSLVRRPVTSPLDGTIEEVHFTQGQLKYQNDKLLTILDLSRVWIEARFPESTAGAAAAPDDLRLAGVPGHEIRRPARPRRRHPRSHNPNRVRLLRGGKSEPAVAHRHAARRAAIGRRCFGRIDARRRAAERPCAPPIPLARRR